MRRRAELESLLERDPDDVKAASVLADLLIELGDPLGEELQRRMAGAPTIVHDRQTVSELLVAREARWATGFLRRVGAYPRRGGGFPEVRAVLDAPIARFVDALAFRELSLWLPGDGVALRALLDDRPRIRAVTFDGEFAHAHPDFGSPSTALGALPPTLEAVALAGLGVSLWIPALASLPRLERLTLDRTLLSAEDLRALDAVRPRVGPDCTLTLPAIGAAFAVDAALSAWRKREIAFGDSPALLVVGPRAEAGRMLVLKNDVRSVRVGHHANCDLRIEGAGLFAVHCALDRVASEVSLRRLGDSASVQVDGAPVPDAGVALRHGTRMTLGHAELVFLAHGAADAWAAERERWRSR